MRLYTIGFTKRTAEAFFTTLQQAGVRRIVDVRLNNTSQLAAFAKANDLAYFLRAIADIGYIALPSLYPTPEILEAYKKNKGSWSDYERDFKALMAKRRVEDVVKPVLRDGDCLLCSEATPDQCHRRLAAEYLRHYWNDLEVVHL